MRMRMLFAIATVTACRGTAEPDAYGNFESVEVVVSAETGGKIEQFVPEEGQSMARGAVAALIDTSQLSLERRQIEAQQAATGARENLAGAQIQVLEVQRGVAQRNYERLRRLHAEQAATTQQLDQAEREFRTLVAQIAAARAQQRSASLDVTSARARVEQIRDRIGRGTVLNPQAGTVITTYARAGETIQPGQPLYRIANLDTLILRAYLTESQLSLVKLGETVSVNVDGAGGEIRSLEGRVTWISSSAEFTPTPIQTRDDRADLVYAMKVSVPNADGSLKIGMPADVTIRRPPAAGR
jgi:HlyD family secretion protein